MVVKVLHRSALGLGSWVLFGNLGDLRLSLGVWMEWVLEVCVLAVLLSFVCSVPPCLDLESVMCQFCALTFT